MYFPVYGHAERIMRLEVRARDIALIYALAYVINLRRTNDVVITLCSDEQHTFSATECWMELMHDMK